MKPGTLSVIIPPPAEVGGPQQGGAAMLLSGSPETGVPSVTFELYATMGSFPYS